MWKRGGLALLLYIKETWIRWDLIDFPDHPYLLRHHCLLSFSGASSVLSRKYSPIFSVMMEHGQCESYRLWVCKCKRHHKGLMPTGKRGWTCQFISAQHYRLLIVKRLISEDNVTMNLISMERSLVSLGFFWTVDHKVCRVCQTHWGDGNDTDDWESPPGCVISLWQHLETFKNFYVQTQKILSL